MNFSFLKRGRRDDVLRADFELGAIEISHPALRDRLVCVRWSRGSSKSGASKNVVASADGGAMWVQDDPLKLSVTLYRANATAPFDSKEIKLTLEEVVKAGKTKALGSAKLDLARYADSGLQVSTNRVELRLSGSVANGAEVCFVIKSVFPINGTKSRSSNSIDSRRSRDTVSRDSNSVSSFSDGERIRGSMDRSRHSMDLSDDFNGTPLSAVSAQAHGGDLWRVRALRSRSGGFLPVSRWHASHLCEHHHPFGTTCVMLTCFRFAGERQPGGRGGRAGRYRQTTRGVGGWEQAVEASRG